WYFRSKSSCREIKVLRKFFLAHSSIMTIMTQRKYIISGRYRQDIWLKVKIQWFIISNRINFKNITSCSKGHAKLSRLLLAQKIAPVLRAHEQSVTSTWRVRESYPRGN